MNFFFKLRILIKRVSPLLLPFKRITFPRRRPIFTYIPGSSRDITREIGDSRLLLVIRRITFSPAYTRHGLVRGLMILWIICSPPSSKAGLRRSLRDEGPGPENRESPVLSPSIRKNECQVWTIPFLTLGLVPPNRPAVEDGWFLDVEENLLSFHVEDEWFQGNHLLRMILGIIKEC